MEGLSKVLAGLMENPNFLKWFGKSAVRDAKGMPMRVYHGTSKDFDQFIPGGVDWASRTGNTNGNGIYFTVNPDQAGAYASGEGGRIIPGFVRGNIVNFDNLTPEARTQIELHVGKRLKENRDLSASFDLGTRKKYYPSDNQDGIDFYNTQKKNWEYFDGYKYRNKPIVDKDEKGIFVEYNDPTHPGIFSMGDGTSGFNRMISYFGGDTSNVLRDAGFDGHRVGNQVIMYDPRNFKSSFNQGTFDPTDPNFLKSMAPVATAGGAGAAMAPFNAEAAVQSGYPSFVQGYKSTPAHAMESALEAGGMEEAWNPVEALAGGLGGGLRGALTNLVQELGLEGALKYFQGR